MPEDTVIIQLSVTVSTGGLHPYDWTIRVRRV